MTNETTTRTTPNAVRYIVLAALVVGAFLGAYQFAQARNASSVAQDASALTAGGAPGGAPVGAPGGATLPAGSAADDGGAVPACACCGSGAPTEGGVTGTHVQGEATVEGGVQRISIDLSQGYYEPNVIVLDAGVPTEITFAQSSGCTGQVLSKDLNFFEDLTTGPKTVSIPALEAGDYAFSCGMEMVFGKIVVQ